MDDYAAAQQSLLGPGTYLYLHCGATGWGLDAATRVQPTADPNVYQVTYSVSQPWMVSGSDGCILTETNQLNGWGTNPRRYTNLAATSTPMSVPSSAQLSESATYFNVRYPALGQYRARVNKANSTLTIESATASADQDAWGACLSSPKASKVLLVVYDPYHPATKRDDATRNASNPVPTTISIANAIRANSHGLVNYQLVGVEYVNDNPARLADGSADYNAIFQRFDVCNRVQQDNLTEVWVWAGNNAGLDELAYRVPADAIPYADNIVDPWFYTYRTKNIPDCGKTVWVMGYNFAVEPALAQHSYNHRVESILSIMVGKGRWYDTQDPQNVWRQYSLFNREFPGQASVGNTHEPFTSSGGYDYSNTTFVTTRAADWLNYPNLTGATQNSNCNAWGCTQWGYQNYYQSHLPHVAGNSHDACNSWWTYIADYDRRIAPCTGSNCLAPVGAPCGANNDCSSNNCKCGSCATAGSNPTCKTVNFSACTTDSQCASGVCGCDGETGASVCLPNTSYAATCKKPAGADCTDAGDCQSGRCGCNGGTTLHCLAASETTTCSNVDNWFPCLQDSHCASGVCGCGGGAPPKVCLPSEAYPRSCL
ncbi:MAG TPA: hypothetical protein VFZ53_11230 [Polyangiaceae bacterium]